MQFDCSTNSIALIRAFFGEIRLYLMPVVYSGQIALLKKKCSLLWANCIIKKKKKKHQPLCILGEKSAAMVSVEILSRTEQPLGGNTAWRSSKKRHRDRCEIRRPDCVVFPPFHRVGGPGRAGLCQIQWQLRLRSDWGNCGLRFLYNFIPETPDL